MKFVILAGGGGTRLFPLSRASYPKQFLKLDGHRSLLAATVERFLPLAAPEDIIIVTNQDYYHHVLAELQTCGAERATILLEPAARNTAPAIALAARYCLDELQAPPSEVLFVSPSDHIIRPADKLQQAVRQAGELARDGKVVTFGVRPDKPETGYGYIEAGVPYGPGYEVACFHEKPDRATAEKYLAAGNYWWNSGMFAFTIGTIMSEFKAHSPDIFQLAATTTAQMRRDFATLPDISLDYAVAEKSDRVVTIPLDLYWNDIGSWDAIYQVLDKDGAGNVQVGDVVSLDCADSLIIGHDRLIAGIGLTDTIVVETDDVVVVAKKGESQQVKDLVALLKSRRRKEAYEHTTAYRPWGQYTVLGEGPGYKMKKITVNPGQRLSLQMHYHRSEHWIVIAGTASVTIGDEVKFVHENQSVYVPKATKHRLENPGRIPLAVIEVQNGAYLAEDDIVRFDDQYGRC